MAEDCKKPLGQPDTSGAGFPAVINPVRVISRSGLSCGVSTLNSNPKGERQSIPWKFKIANNALVVSLRCHGKGDILPDQ